MDKIKELVYDYVAKNSGKVDNVDVAHHICKQFDVTMDVPLRQLYILIDEGRVRRVWKWREYVFEVV
jgi:hypothetical protein